MQASKHYNVSIRGKRRRKGGKKWRVKELNWREGGWVGEREGKGVELERGRARGERERREGKR